MRRLFAVPMAAAFAAISIFPAAAQDYPARAVTLVVPYAPGGTTDTMARMLGRRLEQRLGKPFIAENRAGMASIVGASYVAKAAPDGYTIMLATSTTMAINVSIYKKLPYDPTKDLVPVALAAGVPFLLVVNPSLPVKDVRDLVSYANSLPDGLNYASNGHGGAGHLFVELLRSMTGIEKMIQVPYKGFAPALNDVVAGHVPVVFADFSTALPLVRAGKLRAIGVSTAQRLAAAPDIPPLAEAGVPGFDASSWQMVVAPAGVPEPIVAKLNAELRAILAEPEVRKSFETRGILPLVSPGPEELKRYVHSEIGRWGKVVRQAGAAGSQ